MQIAINRVPSGAFISSLFYRSSPATISRLVVAVVVDTINALSGWSFSHIGKKVFKFVPSLANCNSTASVVLPVGRVGVGASAPNVLPSSVHNGIRRPLAMAVSGGCLTGAFSLKTAARTCMAASQIIHEGFCFVSAITEAKEFSVDSSAGMNSCGKFLDYSKALKPFADQVEFSSHNDGQFIVVSSGGRPATTGARCDYFIPLMEGGVNG